MHLPRALLRHRREMPRHGHRDDVSREKYKAVCDERDWLRGALAARAGARPEDVPTVLRAAAAMPDPGGQAVTLDIGGERVICVLGDEPGGTPFSWWASACRLAAERLAS